MSITLNDNLKINVGNPIDSRYLNDSNTVYTSVSAVNSAIVQSQRYVGLTVNINYVEYWYKNGVTDIDLVVKDSGVANTGITKSVNGLTKIGDTVRLGGTITGSTTFTDTRVSPIGLQYGGDYSSYYTPRTIVDASYVTGKTNIVKTYVDNNFYTKTQINNYTGSSVVFRNNYYPNTAVTTNVTLSTGSSYLILVNHANAVTITLPASPFNGEAFKIKDASGNALTKVITISGNGKNIDGSANARINTDYGSVEIVYNSSLNSWFGISYLP